MIHPIDHGACPKLADALGDGRMWSIATHALITGPGRAYMIGELPHFTAAMVVPDYCPDEPFAWGEPQAIWRIASQMSGWKAIEVPSEIAPALAEVVDKAIGRPVKVLDDVFFAGHQRPARIEHPAVRMLEIKDLPLLADAPRELNGGDEQRAGRMLRESFFAAAIDAGRIVG